MRLPFATDKRVIDFRRIGSKYVVIFDYMEYPRDAPAENLSAFRQDGRRLWSTRPRSNSTTDAWIGFRSAEPLVVVSFAGYHAQVDVETGAVLRMELKR